MKKMVVKSGEVVVNINTASVEELQTIRGIGQKMAERIVEKREEIVRFRNLEEVSCVKGFGPEGTIGKKLSAVAANFTFGDDSVEEVAEPAEVVAEESEVVAEPVAEVVPDVDEESEDLGVEDENDSDDLDEDVEDDEDDSDE